ncbi:hypothetical protein D3C83_283680 [compost metagenome]
MREHPFGQIGADLIGCGGERIGRDQRPHLIDAQDFGGVTVLREEIVELFGR